MDKNKLYKMTDEEIEQFAANIVGFILSEYRSLKKILGNGIYKLQEAIRYEVISVGIVSSISELPKENQLESLKKIYLVSKNIYLIYMLSNFKIL